MGLAAQKKDMHIAVLWFDCRMVPFLFENSVKQFNSAGTPIAPSRVFKGSKSSVSKLLIQIKAEESHGEAKTECCNQDRFELGKPF